MDVLVAPAGEVDDHDLVLAHLWCEFHRIRDGMCGFERRHDALDLGRELEGLKGLLVEDGDIGYATGITQPAVLWPDARVVEPGRDRMTVENLAIAVLEEIGPIAVKHARTPCTHRRAVLDAVQAAAT